jgi:prolyl-tRNA synthetase
MRLSQMLFVTLREDPAEAEIPSHKLLLRAGYIRRIGSGLYAYLPLMWRVLKKVTQIVREEMDVTGAQECLLPQLQPSELWEESGRWNTYTKAEGIMFALGDRQGRELGLGPTHEEVITAVARDMIRSYRQLPVHLYQVQSKFRDEIRPRFGLMRGREFIMKDGYSFHADAESLKVTYQQMYQAYTNILRRCGLAFRAVEADSGAIGGSGSHEFMVLAEVGEDEVLYTEDGLYAANIEKAVSLPPDSVPSHFTQTTFIDTPDANTIDVLCQQLNCDSTSVVKNVLYQATLDDDHSIKDHTVFVLVSIRGDQEVNEVKLKNELVKVAGTYKAKAVLNLAIADAESQSQWAANPIPVGYIGPDLSDDLIKANPNVAPKFLRLADLTVADLKNFVTGANTPHQHLVGANWGSSLTLAKTVDVRKATAGDRAIHDSTQTLKTARGIEIGHIFQLGTKYSTALGATFTTEQGEEAPLVMGCYGVGVSRLAQAAVEQSHDKDGIIWPVAIAPYHAIVVIPNLKESAQVKAAEQIYQALNAAGIETLLDDRDERPGVKFKDSELVGIPYRVVTGRSLAQGKVEVVKRADKTAVEIPIAELVSTLKAWIAEAVK